MVYKKEYEIRKLDISCIVCVLQEALLINYVNTYYYDENINYFRKETNLALMQEIVKF